MTMGGSVERRARVLAVARIRGHGASPQRPVFVASGLRFARPYGELFRPTRSVASARTRRFATQSGSFSSPP